MNRYFKMPYRNFNITLGISLSNIWMDFQRKNVMKSQIHLTKSGRNCIKMLSARTQFLYEQSISNYIFIEFMGPTFDIRWTDVFQLNKKRNENIKRRHNKNGLEKGFPTKIYYVSILLIVARQKFLLSKRLSFGHMELPIQQLLSIDDSIFISIRSILKKKIMPSFCPEYKAFVNIDSELTGKKRLWSLPIFASIGNLNRFIQLKFKPCWAVSKCSIS